MWQQGFAVDKVTQLGDISSCGIIKLLNKLILTFRTQLLFTRRFPGLISLCNILAECKYFKPTKNYNQIYSTYHNKSYI